MQILIPARLQVFDTPVVLDTSDSKRLIDHLRGWSCLHKALPRLRSEDLRKLVTLELMNARRPHILSRLTMRISSIQKNAVQKKIAAILKAPCSKKN